MLFKHKELLCLWIDEAALIVADLGETTTRALYSHSFTQSVGSHLPSHTSWIGLHEGTADLLSHGEVIFKLLFVSLSRSANLVLAIVEFEIIFRYCKLFIRSTNLALGRRILVSLSCPRVSRSICSSNEIMRLSFDRRITSSNFVKHLSKHCIYLSSFALDLLLPSRIVLELIGNHGVIAWTSSSTPWAGLLQQASSIAAVGGSVTDAIVWDVGVSRLPAPRIESHLTDVIVRRLLELLSFFPYMIFSNLIHELLVVLLRFRLILVVYDIFVEFSSALRLLVVIGYFTILTHFAGLKSRSLIVLLSFSLFFWCGKFLVLL